MTNETAHHTAAVAGDQTGDTASTRPTPDRVDAHHHLWDIDRRVQAWMATPGYEPMARSFTAAELGQLARANGVRGSVVVQAVSDRAETMELLEIAADDPIVSAVVGWVDLTADDVADQIDALRAVRGGTLLRGIRHQVHDEVDPDWLRRPDVIRGIRAVGDAGLLYELLVKTPHLPAALYVVRQLPEVRFVVDHAAKPPIASGDREPWASSIRSLAEHGNVACKLSGLTTEAAWATWSIDDLRPYAEIVIEAFGPDRLMAGSDWPVCTLAASYGDSWIVADELTAELSSSERHDIAARTAQWWYGLSVAADGAPNTPC
jgi:L-fuconolactonase